MLLETKFNQAQQHIALTIGNFDGLHLGHKKLINETINYAKLNKLQSVALSFEPTSYDFFTNKANRIINIRQKLELLNNIGLDKMILVRFNNKFTQISKEHFINKLLIETLKVKHLVVGEDFKFGKNQSGNIDFLKKYLNKFSLEIIKDEKFEDQRISSSLIRQKLKENDIIKVNQLLGYNYYLESKVIKGKQIGRLIGIPTANLYVKHRLLIDGVFVVKVIYQNNKMLGVANVGKKPTVGSLKSTVEVHIINNKLNLYNERLKIEFLAYIRKTKKFESLNELKQQINYDIEFAKNYKML